MDSTKFSVNKIADKGLQNLNDYLCKFKPEVALTMLRRFNSSKYNEEKIKKLNPPLPSWIFNKAVVPEWFVDYCCQQALILGSDILGKEMSLDDIKKIASYIVDIEDLLCVSENDVPALMRRIKNLQFPYQEPSSTFLGRCYRMLQILELGTKEYDYKKSFKEETGVEPEPFFGFFTATYGHLAFNYEFDGVLEKWFFSEDLLKKATREEIAQILNFISNDRESFKTEFDNLTKRSIRSLSEEVFYKVHNYVPVVFRKKPFYKLEVGTYICPCPKLTEMFFSECLIWLLVKKDKDKFSKWFGDAFETYCRSIAPSSKNEVEVFFETEYMQGIKGPADIIVIIDDSAILFECKLRSFSDAAFITGMEVKNQWAEIEKDKDEILENIFVHLKRIKSNSTVLTEKFKNIKKIYPIRVTYEQIYDVNTIYFLKDKPVPSEVSILTISAREYEMLMEILEDNHDLFMKTIKTLFNPESFHIYRDENGDNHPAAEAFQVIGNEAKMSYQSIKQYKKLTDFFKSYMAQAKQAMFVIT